MGYGGLGSPNPQAAMNMTPLVVSSFKSDTVQTSSTPAPYDVMPQAFCLFGLG